MRTEEEIRADIKKVQSARRAARRKVDRCEERLDELQAELFRVKYNQCEMDVTK